MEDNELELPVTGTETAALFDARSEEILTPEDRASLVFLLTQNDRVDLAIPADMPPAELWRAFDVCARVYRRVRFATGQLKLLIGRALMVIQETPVIYQSRGFSSFDEFMSSDKPNGLQEITGISRAELYKAKKVANSSGPGMSLEDAREIGFTKMALVTGVAKYSDSNFSELMESAKTDTIPQLRERIAKKNLAQPDELEWDVFQVNLTKAQKKFLQSFIDNPQVRAYCETTSPGTILERAISEVIGEWEIRALVIDAQASNI